MIEVVNLSSKGQIVIPKSIREKMGLDQNDKFILVNERDSILLKRIDEEDIKQRFRKIFEKTQIAFKKSRITRDDLRNEIKAVRNEGNN